MEKTLALLQQAVEQMESLANTLKAQLPALQAFARDSAKKEDELAHALKQLGELKIRENNASEALKAIESALRLAMDTARENIIQPQHSLEERLKLLSLCADTFAQLAKAGFEIWIPRIGDPVDPAKHIVRGKTHSPLNDSQVADVVSWGYRFPSGDSRLAEVLVGDASVPAEEPQTPPEPPKERAGIPMLQDTEEPPQKPPAKAPKTKKEQPPTPFEELMKAAERNRQKKQNT
jgi:hypothetical protein